jgi:hypothetical protein
MPLLNYHLRFRCLRCFCLALTSGFPLIFSLSEDSPDSIFVIPVRLSMYVVLDDFNIGTRITFAKYFLWFLLTGC